MQSWTPTIEDIGSANIVAVGPAKSGKTTTLVHLATLCESDVLVEFNDLVDEPALVSVRGHVGEIDYLVHVYQRWMDVPMQLRRTAKYALLFGDVDAYDLQQIWGRYEFADMTSKAELMAAIHAHTQKFGCLVLDLSERQARCFKYEVPNGAC